MPELVNADANICLYREFGRLLCEDLERPYLQAPIGILSTTKFLRSLGEILGLDPEPFIEREKHTTIKPVWDLWRSVTQDFFGTASFGIVATETYARGVRHFLEDEMGLPCHFAFGRCRPAQKPDNAAIRGLHRGEAAPGPVRFVQRADVRSPRAARGRSTCPPRSPARSSGGTPARRSWASPARPTSSRRSATPCSTCSSTSCRSPATWTQVEADAGAAPPRSCPGTRRPGARLDELVEAHPVLVRISAAKRLRDAAERVARGEGTARVAPAHVERARAETRLGAAA